MDGQVLLRSLSQLAGAAVVLLSMADVFMTVLYARVGTGHISHRLAVWGWAFARRGARALPGNWKDGLLSYFGPAYLFTLLATWVGLLLLGFTLIAWPSLGHGIQSTSGHTPTDFLTAFYYAGGSMTTVGSGDIRPVAPLFRFLTVIDSVIGISVVTLAVTYVIEVYTALHARNALALGLHHASGGTGDAAAMLAGSGAGDDFSHGASQLAGLASEATAVYEYIHFYPVLTHFRFREPHYAVPRAALVSMETVALAETALDDDRHGWLRSSGASCSCARR